LGGGSPVKIAEKTLILVCGAGYASNAGSAASRGRMGGRARSAWCSATQDAGGPVGGVAGPAMGSLFDPLPVGPAEEGGIEVAPGEAADLAHHRGALALAGFELIGEEDDLGD